MRQRIHIYWGLAFVFAAFASCQKNNIQDENLPRQIKDFPQVGLNFDVDSPEAEDADPATKIIHSETSAGVHHITWKKGDEFSMFGAISAPADHKGTAINFSANRFALKYGDGSKTFSGYIPDIQTMYGSSSGVQMKEYCIYPATTVQDYDASKVPDLDVVPSTKLTLPTTQDGTGWPYCFFFSATAMITATTMNPTASYASLGVGMKFSLGNLLIRLKLNSTKNVTKIVLSTSDAPVLVGDVTKIHCAYSSMYISSGCATKTLTVENGGALPDDVYFAVRDLRKDKTYTLTFTAEDNTTIVKQFKPSVVYEKKVLSLGTITLDTWN